MTVQLAVFGDKAALGMAAAECGAAAIRAAQVARGHAAIIVATGISQYEVLAHLVQATGIDWSRVTAFHLDEYVGLPASHPASFRCYLGARFCAPLHDAPHFVPVAGDAPDAEAEAVRLGALIAGHAIDVCFAGIGENGHLAFNDPPADFATTAPYIVVELDEACRRQQLGEGWFPTLDAVPRRAISMSIHRMLQSRLLVVSVSDTRKAAALQEALEGPVTPLCPASVLQDHSNTRLFADGPAAALLRPERAGL